MINTQTARHLALQNTIAVTSLIWRNSITKVLNLTKRCPFWGAVREHKPVDPSLWCGYESLVPQIRYVTRLIFIPCNLSLHKVCVCGAAIKNVASPAVTQNFLIYNWWVVVQIISWCRLVGDWKNGTVWTPSFCVYGFFFAFCYACQQYWASRFHAVLCFQREHCKLRECCKPYLVIWRQIWDETSCRSGWLD